MELGNCSIYDTLRALTYVSAKAIAYEANLFCVTQSDMLL